MAWGIVGVVVIVVLRHRENVVRFWRGEEGRVFGGLWEDGGDRELFVN